MRTFFRALLALVILAVVGIAAIAFFPTSHSAPAQSLPADWKPKPGQGLYVAQMADCMACHTTANGKPFAGGLGIESPFGLIYTSNITPDKDAGIGGWTLDQFRAALVDGVAPGNRRLYPAMPYENYRAMSEEDIRALYDYFMKEVKPVAERPPATQLAFPYNQRWGIRVWNWLALGKAGFNPAESVVGADPSLRRGAYLVQALGHCGACHSPRTDLFAQQGLTGADARFLTGGVIGDWVAPDLRGAKSAAQRWSHEQLKAFLRTGRNAETGVTGEMALAIEHSLSHMTDDDATAMTAYLQALGPGGPRKPGGPAAPASDADGIVARLDASTDATAKKLAAAKDLTEGERLYLDNCAVCHFTDGRGAPEVFPALAGNSLVTSAKPQGLITTILIGAAMPSTALRPERLIMPGFAQRLDDEEVAALAGFLRKAWGNDAAAVTPGTVADTRKKAVAHAK